MVLSNCGSWTTSVGTTYRSDYGAKNQNQMVYYSPSREEWRNITTQNSTYQSEYTSLISSFDVRDFQDIDEDGRRDSNEPRRARS